MRLMGEFRTVMGSIAIDVGMIKKAERRGGTTSICLDDGEIIQTTMSVAQVLRVIRRVSEAHEEAMQMRIRAGR